METTPTKNQHQKSYSVDFKLQVLDWYYSNGKNKLKTATHFNIHTKRIRDWELNEAFLRAHSDSPKRRFRMEKAAADTYGNVGKNLFLWYQEEKTRGLEHSFGDLKSKAVQLATELNVQDCFTVSDSWIRRWKKQYGVEDGKRRSAATGMSEGIVEVDRSVSSCLDTEQGDVITLPTILQVQADAVSEEGIVYVSEPQQIAPTTEEVIDMVENPISVAQENEVTQQATIPTAVLAQELCEQQRTSLLKHLFVSLDETKSKLEQQELLTKQALYRAEEAEKTISECKSRISVLELDLQQLKGSVALTPSTEDLPVTVNSGLSIITAVTATN